MEGTDHPKSPPGLVSRSIIFCKGVLWPSPLFYSKLHPCPTSAHPHRTPLPRTYRSPLTQPRDALPRRRGPAPSPMLGLELLLLLPRLLQDPSGQPRPHILLLLFSGPATPPLFPGPCPHRVPSQNLFGQGRVLFLTPGPTGRLEFGHLPRKTVREASHVQTERKSLECACAVNAPRPRGRAEVRAPLAFGGQERHQLRLTC